MDSERIVVSIEADLTTQPIYLCNIPNYVFQPVVKPQSNSFYQTFGTLVGYWTMRLEDCLLLPSMVQNYKALIASLVFWLGVEFFKFPRD